MEFRQLRSKVGVKRHIVEILIRHFRLVSVLEGKRGVLRDAVCFPKRGWKPGHYLCKGSNANAPSPHLMWARIKEHSWTKGGGKPILCSHFALAVQNILSLPLCSQHLLGAREKIPKGKQDRGLTSRRNRCFRYLLGWMQPYWGPSL